jgi:hypothetical protein
MVAPWLAFAGIVAVKKIIGFALWKAGNSYGWPRVYRRLLEYSKRVTPLSAQPVVRASLKTGLRLPGQAVSLLKKPEVQQYLETLENSTFAKSCSVIPGVHLSAVIKAVRSLPETFIMSVAKQVEEQAAKHPHAPHGTSGSDKPLR